MTSAERGSGFLGASLPAKWLLGVLAVSVVVFLWWGGPLWGAAYAASHMGRIAVSYLIVPPLIAGALIVTKRWGWVRLASSLGLVWAAKLVLTSTLYFSLAPGSASQYTPSRAWQDAGSPVLPAAASRYRAAQAPQDLADISGVVVDAGAPVEGAIVVIERPPPGLLPRPPHDLEWSLRNGSHDESLRLAWKGDRVSIINHDAELHTVRFSDAGRARWNVAVPAQATARTGPLGQAGVYDLFCDKHAAERATLVIVDHPYAAVTDGSGRFSLRGVPTAVRELLVLRSSGPPTHHRLSFAENQPLAVALDVGTGHGGNE